MNFYKCTLKEDNIWCVTANNRGEYKKIICPGPQGQLTLLKMPKYYLWREFLLHSPIGDRTTISLWSSKPHECLTICRSKQRQHLHLTCSYFNGARWNLDKVKTKSTYLVSRHFIMQGVPGVLPCALHCIALPVMLAH